MQRRLPTSNLLKQQNRRSPASPRLASFFTYGLFQGFHFFLSVCNNADALEECQMASNTCTLDRQSYIISFIPFHSSPCSVGTRPSTTDNTVPLSRIISQGFAEFF